MYRITVQTRQRKEMIDITTEISKVLRENKINDGICVIFVPHTTCGITINENADPSVRMDMVNTLSSIVPEYGKYRHTEGNSDAHIQSSVVGHSVTLIIENGKIQLGTWQGVFLCEFDGPRTREIWLKMK
jgi:secondary thiamine-phosphate synthase enzyme